MNYIVRQSETEKSGKSNQRLQGLVKTCFVWKNKGKHVLHERPLIANEKSKWSSCKIVKVKCSEGQNVARIKGLNEFKGLKWSLKGV